mmetsp:Transcript_10748/g.16311  ORF Transcript_10748/g.16311 Transcript_10748/m.16311 type:complete len:116 (-) Transcript_10748:509-856(-)
MSWFCPLDGTLLQIQTPSSNESSSSSSNSMFVCSTCPFSCDIRNNFTNTTRPDRKEVDDILGGAAAWENVDKTAAVCPACSCGEAYFMQMQIRSADEPMSVFYKCVNCSNQWNDK